MADIKDAVLADDIFSSDDPWFSNHFTEYFNNNATTVTAVCG